MPAWPICWVAFQYHQNIKDPVFVREVKAAAKREKQYLNILKLRELVVMRIHQAGLLWANIDSSNFTACGQSHEQLCFICIMELPINNDVAPLRHWNQGLPSRMLMVKLESDRLGKPRA